MKRSLFGTEKLSDDLEAEIGPFKKRAQLLNDLVTDIKRALHSYQGSRLKRTPEEVLHVILKNYGDPFFEDFSQNSVLAYTAVQCGHLQRDLVKERNDHEERFFNILMGPIKKLTAEYAQVAEQLRILGQKSSQHEAAEARVKTMEDQKLRRSTRTRLEDDKELQRLEELRATLEDCSKSLVHETDVTVTALMNYVAKEAYLAEVLFDDSVQFQLDYYKKCSEEPANYLPTLKEVIESYSLKPVFGVHLESQDEVSEGGISRVIEECCSMMLKLGLEREGLLRVPGRTVKIKLIIAALNYPDPINWSCLVQNDIHSVGGAFKQYLRELPDPLLTYALYDQWIALAKEMNLGKPGEKPNVVKVNQLLLQLPGSHYVNLRYVIKFLVEICKFSDDNKMSPENVAIVMGSNLLRSRNDEGSSFRDSPLRNLIVETLIRYHEDFFPSKFSPKLVEEPFAFGDEKGSSPGAEKVQAKQTKMGFQKFGSSKSGDSCDAAFDDLHVRVEMIFNLMHQLSKNLTSVKTNWKSNFEFNEPQLDRKLERVIGDVLAQHGTKILDELSSKSILSGLCKDVADLENQIASGSLEHDRAIKETVERRMEGCEDEYKVIKRNLEKVPRALQKMEAARGKLKNLQTQLQRQGSVSPTQAEKAILEDKVLQAQIDLEEREKSWETEKDNATTLMMKFITKEHQFAAALLDIIDHQSLFYETTMNAISNVCPQFREKISSFSPKPCYGVSLQSHLRVSQQKIARPLMELCNVMKDLGLENEGLLRVSGGVSKTGRIVAALDYPDKTDWTCLGNNVHSVASAMKKYLRDLPEPLLGYSHYSAWEKLVGKSAEMPSNDLKLQISGLLQKIPMENFYNLAFLIQFLDEIVAVESNKMSLENVAMIMGPNILWKDEAIPIGTAGVAASATLSSAVCQLILKHNNYCFPEPVFKHKSYLKSAVPAVHASEFKLQELQLPDNQPVLRRKDTLTARKAHNLIEKQRNHRRATVYKAGESGITDSLTSSQPVLTSSDMERPTEASSNLWNANRLYSRSDDQLATNSSPSDGGLVPKIPELVLPPQTETNSRASLASSSLTGILPVAVYPTEADTQDHTAPASKEEMVRTTIYSYIPTTDFLPFCALSICLTHLRMILQFT